MTGSPRQPSGWAVLYHGTSQAAWEQIRREGLRPGPRACAHVCDSLAAARQYAEQAARRDRSAPAVLAVTLPACQVQPNGSCAPPYFRDSWHEDSGMPGRAWEHDAPVAPSQIRLLSG